MRRFAAVALAAGAMTAGLGALAMPAQAAPSDISVTVAGQGGPYSGPVTTAARSWTTKDAYPNLRAWGSARRQSGRFYFSGTLKDGKADGWSACVRFRATEAGHGTQFSRYTIVAVRPNGSRYYFDGKAQVKISGSFSNSGHLFVQECRRSKSTGKFQFANKKWRQVF